MDPRALLAADFPDLQVDVVERLGQGWDHVAFLVNEAFVFRVPRRLVEPGGGDVDTPSAMPEVELLRAVAGKLTVAVPEPVYVGGRGEYFGYKYLPGPSLEDLLEHGSWLPGGDESFADLVVEVVTGLEQAVAADEAMKIGLGRAVAPQYPEEERRALGSRRLSAPMRSVSDSVVDGIPRLWASAMARPTVTLHADLGLDHWITADEVPYALIDWSDSCVGPPELQLSTLMWHKPELAARAALGYSQQTGHGVDGDLVFCCGYENALSDLGSLLGDDDTDEEDVEWCLEFLRRWSSPELASTLRGVHFGE